MYLRTHASSVPFTFTSPSSSLHIPLSPYTAHESALEDVCWITSGIQSLFVTSFGGDFPLVSVGGEEGDKQVIQLCVPPGAVKADGEGVVEVHYAMIPCRWTIQDPWGV